MRMPAISLVLTAVLGATAFHLHAEEASPTTPPEMVSPPVVLTEIESPDLDLAAAEVRWASPTPGAILFRPADVTLDWTSTYPAGTRYSVTLSRDKENFNDVIADGILDTSTSWSLPDIRRVHVWLRVKAMDELGQMLGEDIVPIRILPDNAIVISKANQRLWAFRDGRLEKQYVISTGLRDTHDTRDGWYSVYMRSRDHHSRLYDIAMPFALFFSGGQAIHASTALRDLGSPASHGCIRLPRRQARALFDSSEVGRPVIVTPWGMDMSYLNVFRAQRKDSTTPKKTASTGAARPQ